MEGIQNELMGKREYNIKDLLPKKRPQPNASDIYYIEVIVAYINCAMEVKFLLSQASLVTIAVLFLLYLQDLVTAVKRALYETLSEFDGNVDDENDLEQLIDQQFEALRKAMKIPHKASEAKTMVAKKFLTLFRTGKLGTFILDDVPDVKSVS